MNESTTGIVVCESMHEAIEECIASLEGTFRIYPIVPSCTFTLDIGLFRHFLDRSIIENDVTLLAYGICHPQILELLAEYGNQVVKVKGNNCYEMFLGIEKYAEYHRKCYWMLNKPFFTKWKRDVLVGWGAGTVNGRMLIEESYKKLVYVRFKQDKLDMALVEDFADSVGLEYEVHSVDMGNLKRLLEEALASASQTRQRKLPASSLMHPSQPDVQTILDNIGEIIYRIDVHTKEFIFISPQVKTILGYTQAEFIDILNNYVIVPLYHEDEREKVMIGRYNFLIKCLNERMQEPHQMEYRVTHKNGNLLWVKESVYPTYSSEGVIESFVGKIVDITERKRAEEALQKAHNDLEKRVKERTAELEGLAKELKNEILERQQIEMDLNRLNRAYLMVCECNQELIRITDEQSLLNNICRIIAGTGGYRFVWVGFAEHDENKTVRPVASAGYEEGYLESIDITWADEPGGRGPTGTAIRTGKPTIARNILTDPQFAPWRDRAVKRGYASSIALPLHMDRENIAALNIYASEPKAFDDEEVDLLIKLAGNLSYGITSLRIRAERNRAEEALKESEELYRTLVETAPDGVIMTDPEGRLIYVSQRTVELHGYERAEELLGRSALDLIAPEDREKAAKNVQKTLEEGFTRVEEITLLRKDGTHYIGGVNATTLKGADGRPRAFIATTRDITKRKRAEEALRDSEEKYRAIFESSSDQLIYCNKYGTIISANDHAETYGRKPEDVIGKNFTKLGYFSAKDIPKYLRLFKDVITGKKNLNQFEIEIKHKDGHKIPVEVSTSLIRKNGKIEGLLCVVRDITERKRAEDALRSSEEKFRLLFEHAPVGIFQSTHGSGLITANPALVNLLGYDSEDEVRNLDIAQDLYMNPEDREVITQKLESAGKLHNVELILKLKDGTPITVLENAYTVYDAHDKVKYYEGMVVDITERKQAEKALRESERSLAEAQRIGRIGNWDLDLVKDELKWSDEIYRIFGLEPQKFGATYEAFLDTVHPDDREYVDTMYTDSIKNNTPYDIVHRIIRKSDREVRHVHEKCEHFKDQTGKILRSIGTVQDITELKRVETELKATQEQLRNLSTHLQSVREEDRASLAREIHDELGQALTVLKFGLMELKNALPADRISLVEKVTSMAGYIDTTAQTINKIAMQLRPTLLDELGLVEAIEWEVEEFENRTGIKCKLMVEPEEMVVDRDRSTAIYRIVQEALTNIARHAQTTRSAVSLKMSDGKLHLSITDNGIGITEDKVLNPKALGIIGMRERVFSVGGNFKIDGIKDRGTKIRVIIPVKGENKADD